MGKKTDKASDGKKVVARNRRAHHDYTLTLEVEAGIQLRGSEVKGLREGGTAIDQAYCSFKNGELWLHGANVPEYRNASWNVHEPRRVRKLLLHRHQLTKLEKAAATPGTTIVPIELYFNADGRAKLRIAVGRGKKLQDKRSDLAKKSAKREMDRALGRRR